MSLPSPQVRDQDRPYWDAATNGKLLIKHCRACDENFHYPRPICPFCMSRDTEWLEVSGEGAIYSFSLFRRKGTVESIPAFVTLDEGPTMLTLIVDCDGEALSIGERVKVTFTPTEGGPPLPVFTPIQS